MLHSDDIAGLAVADLLARFPFMEAFFRDNGIVTAGRERIRLVDLIGEREAEDRGTDGNRLAAQAAEYINRMLAFLGEGEQVTRITILPGRDKSGQPEGFETLEIRTSEIISIVGPTGSGKSRLLADIEWVAQADTPTGRRVLINGAPPDPKWRFSSADKLVAQLSQNMNFVMDLSVREFVALHAESRMIRDADSVVERIIAQANELAGEPFTPETAITALSGGQSRALMIADTAILSKSPIILIDEIENAGIDRQRALALLLSEEKIVLMATHDPVLALMADKRLVIKNGGIASVVETTEQERSILGELRALDAQVLEYRARLRRGERLDTAKEGKEAVHA